jgi:hypothetical protein
MDSQDTGSGRWIALAIPALVVIILAVLTFSSQTFWSLFGGSDSGSETAAATYDASEGVQFIVNAEPNDVPEGDPREPWLGEQAWIVAVQAGQEYISEHPEPQNVQVLTGMTTAEIWIYMQQHVSGALGVSCQYCHDINNYAADPYPEKITSRLMMRLVQDINGNYLSQAPAWGGRYTQCATCHTMQPQDMLAFSKENAYLSVDPTTGQSLQTWVIDTYAIAPSNDFVVQHPNTGIMLAMVHSMEENWPSYALPPREPITGPFPRNDRQYYQEYNDTIYSVPNCYTCHRGNQIPAAAISRYELEAMDDAGQTVLPFVLRGLSPEEIDELEAEAEITSSE